MNTPTEPKKFNAKGNVEASIVEDPDFYSETVNVYQSGLTFTIAGNPQENEIRTMDFHFRRHTSFEDGSYEIPFIDQYNYVRYVHPGVNYYYTGNNSKILYLTVKNNGTHYSGYFEGVEFTSHEDSWPIVTRMISASFDVEIGDQQS
ncbi:hypothetical protein ABH905_001439 [Pseudomonas frederiksbergensis]|uniref:hypothetical protein n=1 Tax=Pseudomonas frederiksbergensis TaxID=104087 RepID=UPI003D1EF6BA